MTSCFIQLLKYCDLSFSFRIEDCELIVNTLRGNLIPNVNVTVTPKKPTTSAMKKIIVDDKIYNFSYSINGIDVLTFSDLRQSFARGSK